MRAEELSSERLKVALVNTKHKSRRCEGSPFNNTLATDMSAVRVQRGNDKNPLLGEMLVTKYFTSLRCTTDILQEIIRKNAIYIKNKFCIPVLQDSCN